MIRGAAAKPSPAVVVMTTFTLLVFVGLVIATWLHPRTPIVIIGTVLGAIALGCYLRSPVAYEITPGNQLTIRLRLGSHVFGPVRQCVILDGPVSFGLRLWGNGGLFAVTGIFWNGSFGKFRAYVTNLRKLVLVEAQDGGKIIISPDNTQEWSHEAQATR